VHGSSLDVFFYKYQKLLVLCSFLFTIFVFAVLIVSAKPVQDDYATLFLVSENGFIGFLNSHWQSHGGNIWPMALHALVVASALDSFNFISISIFIISTIFLIAISILYFFSKLLKQPSANEKLFLYILIVGTSLGFEGLFSPGLIGSYLFSSASLVHLWPVCFFVLGISKSISTKRYWVGLFLLGIVTGNTNISESVAFIFTILLIKKMNMINNINDIKTATKYNINIFFSGVLFGTLLILIAPGFWVRANSVRGTSIESISTYFLEFMKSFLIFAVDVISHPVFYIFLILGSIYGRKILNSMHAVYYFPILEILFICLFLSLVVGSVFAYPAWHQSLGLLFLLPFCAFSLGTKFAIQVSNLLGTSRFFLLVLFIGILSFSIIRATSLVIDRSSDWKTSNDRNICKIKINNEIGIQNPELLYPPFSLGVEDIQSWPWIKDAYIGWINNNNTVANKQC